MCFVNKQLTYVIKIFFLLERKLPSKPALSNASFGVLEVKKCCVPSELRDFFYVQTLLYAIYYRYIVKSEYKKSPITLKIHNIFSLPIHQKMRLTMLVWREVSVCEGKIFLLHRSAVCLQNTFLDLASYLFKIWKCNAHQNDRRNKPVILDS